MGNLFVKDALKIEKKMAELHEWYQRLVLLKEKNETVLERDEAANAASYRAMLKDIAVLKRRYQNRIEADKDFLEELAAMISQMPEKFAKHYVLGYATCPQAIDMGKIRSFYAKVIEDTTESFTKRLFKRDGYYDWKKMTLDFMRLAEEAELFLQNDIGYATSECAREVASAEQSADLAKRRNEEKHRQLEQKKNEQLSSETSQLQIEREKFISGELVSGFDRRVMTALTDTGGLDSDWSGYTASRAPAKSISIGKVSQEIHSASVSLTKQLIAASTSFRFRPDVDSMNAYVDYSEDFALPCDDTRRKKDRISAEKKWKESGVDCSKTKQNGRSAGLIESFTPYFITLDKNFRLYYAHGGEKVADITEEIQSIVLKRMRSLPAETLSIYFIDPVSRGSSLGVLNASREANESIGIHVCNTKEDIRKTLKKIELMVDEVVSRLGKFSSVKEFNKNNKDRIPETMLVISDFPENFDLDSLEVLKTIIKNSEKCGMDTIVSSEHPAHYLSLNDNVPRFDWSVFIKEKWTYITRMGIRFMLSENGHNYVSYELCSMSESQRTFVNKYRKMYADSLKIDNKFSSIFDAPDQTEYKDATNGIMLPIMIRNGKKDELCNFAIGADANSTHTLITGSTGSGKSSFLHMIITSILLNYHPDDVELWMIDYGKVEFAQYVKDRPASIRFLATEKSEEFTSSFLNYLKSFFERREELFAKEGVNDIKAYRQKCGRLSMPRVILMIDEFHIMTQQVQQDIRYKTILENILTDYRKYGLSCIFSNQTLSALSGLSDTGKKQIKKRIAMMNSLDEMKMTLDVSNENYSGEMIRQMERTVAGEIWCKEQVSDRDFTINHFTAVYINDKERASILKIISSRSIAPNVDCDVYVINDAKREGISIGDFRTSNVEPKDNRIVSISMGTPVTIEREFHFDMEQRYNNNLLILGRDIELTCDLVEIFIANICAQVDSRLLIFADPMDDTYRHFKDGGKFDKYDNIEVYDNIDNICRIVNRIYNQIKSRNVLTKRTYVVWLGYADIFDEFNVSPDKRHVKFEEDSVVSSTADKKIDFHMALQDEELLSMAKGMGVPLEALIRSVCKEENLTTSEKPHFTDDCSYNACSDVDTLIRMGGKFNLFTVMAFSSYGEIRRIKGFELNLFIHKIATSMPREESFDWGLKSFASELDSDSTAVYYDGEKARKFKPYIIK